MSANPRITDTPLNITNINGTFYYHRDHQGSIIALTDEQINGDGDAEFICKLAEGATQESLKDAANLAKEGAFLPGTFGGGPIPTNLADCASSEIQAKLRDMNGTK